MCLKLKLKLKRLLFRTKKSDIQNIKQDKTLKVGQKIRTSSTKILHLAKILLNVNEGSILLQN